MSIPIDPSAADQTSRCVLLFSGFFVILVPRARSPVLAPLSLSRNGRRERGQNWTTQPVVSWSRGLITRGSESCRYRMSENFWHPVMHVQKLKISLLMLMMDFCPSLFHWGKHLLPELSPVRWPKSVKAISICSQQFQFTHDNFNFFTATLKASSALLTSK